MSGSSRKHCVVAYATPEEQWLWDVSLPVDATVADAINAAREIACRDDVPWNESPAGIFGQPCKRTDIPQEGDRIELYRPLASDPRERRRQQVQRQRRAVRDKGGRSGG